MLRAQRRGFLKREYEVSADGRPVTVLAGARREGCEFSLSGTGFGIERDGRKRFVLHGPDGQMAVAERQSGREWQVKAASGNLTLAKPSVWRSGWEIQGTTVGAIRHERGFRHTYSADVPADVPLPIGVFVFYVVLVIFERQAAAAASASAAGS
jgi:hypothetical protein